MISGEDPVRLGIIGCGLAANRLHWPALQKLVHRFVITAVCNHTPAKAVRFAETIGTFYGRDVPYVLDYRELLTRPEVDAVSVVLPVERNTEVCREAAEAGKHVLVEKPIAEDLDGAACLLALEKKYPALVMMVAENFRYRPVFSALVDVLLSGRIGVPYHVEWRSWQRLVPETSEYARTDWRVHHRYEGGFVTDAGVHNVAALRDMFGELECIGAATACVNPVIGRLDTLVYLFRTEGCEGIPPMSGVLNLGFSVHGITDSGIQVLGSRGTAVVDRTALTVYGGASGDVVLEQNYPDDGGYYEEYLDFYEAIVKGKTPISTFTKAYGDLRTILEAVTPSDIARNR